MFGTCNLCRRKAAISAIFGFMLAVMALVTEKSGNILYLSILVTVFSTVLWLAHIYCARKGAALGCRLSLVPVSRGGRG